MENIKFAVGMLAFVLISTAQTFGQSTNIQIISVTATDERAPLITWESESNMVYRIEYASVLVDSNTLWQLLYEDYPSHGTNTFIADAGNYDVTPRIIHPKYSLMRFYRIARVEGNTSPTNPTVSIVSPTNGASLSGDVTLTVSSSSSESLSEVKLYVDGELQWPSDDGANFVINTCEWPNGPHTLFATAKSQSGLEGAANGAAVTYGRSVSSYINVTFDNLITKFDFSEPFFEPSEGQIQKVTATFAANVDWTLAIQNVNSNTVRYVTGSGGSMEFEWDGTGTNGVAIPDGLYSYVLTAQTNGAALEGGAGGGGGGGPPSPMMAAMAAGGTSYFIGPPPMPPVKKDGKWHSWEDVYGPLEPLEIKIPESIQERFLQSLEAAAGLASTNSFSIASAGFGGGQNMMMMAAATQTTKGPTRKPKVGVKNLAGTFGVCYKTYGTNGFQSDHPRTGWPSPLPVFVAIDGQSATAQTRDQRIWSFPQIADDFAATMKKAGWKQKFLLRDDQWGGNDIKKASLGGSNLFNACNFGLMMTHGSFGNNSSAGAEADGVKYTYIPLLIIKNTVKEWIRFSDMDLGGAGTNGLKWMTFLACNILRPANITSMANAGKLPDNDYLHLIMGCSTTAYAAVGIGRYYASNLVANVTVPSSWINAGTQAYNDTHGGITNTVKFRYYGYINCFSDTIWHPNEPDPNTGVDFVEQTVFALP